MAGRNRNDFDLIRVKALVRERLFGTTAGTAVLGRFEVRERLGRGASGVVYRAYDPQLDREVALKVLLGQRATTERTRARLVEEGRALARLSHANVVAVHDVGEHEGELFLAMQLVRGTDLREWLATDRPWTAVLDMLAQAGAGLAAAHRAGLVHRDFKPENVLIDETGVARVADFGLVGAIDAGTDEAAAERPIVPAGTPAYMAPEQWRADHAPGVPVRGASTPAGPVDARADQFAFCVVAWEALFGERPFAGDDPESLRRSVTEGRIRPPPRGRAPSWLRRVLERGLRVVRDERHASMEALLDTIARARAARRRRAPLMIGASLLLIAASVAVAAVGRSEPVCRPDDRLASVWSPPRRAAIARAFDRARVPYATKILAAVETGLDRYARDWSAGSLHACEATHVRHQQSEALLDRRMACLDRARRDLAATVFVLEHADAGVVQRARDLVEQLPDLDECADVAALVARPQQPRGAGAGEIEDALARARAALHAGRFEEGLAAVTPMVERVRQSGDRSLEAELLLVLGALQHEAGRFPEAQESLFDAFTAASDARDERAIARSAIAMAGALEHGPAEYDDALRWLRSAEPHLVRAGRPARLEADRLTTLGEIESGLQQSAEAYETHRRAVDQVRAAYGPDSPRLAMALSRLGWAARGVGRPGCDYHHQALAIRLRAFGEDHPELADSYNRLANCAFEADDTPEGVRLYEKALSIRRAALGDEHREVARTCNNFAWLRLSHDQLEEAAELYRCAQRAYTAAGDDRRRGLAVAGIAEVRYRQSRFEESLTLLGEARAIQEGVPGIRRSLELLHFQLGNVLRALGRPAEAQQEYRRAIEIAAALADPVGTVVGTAELGLGLAHLERGDAAGAVPVLERSLATAVAARPIQPPVAIGAVELHLARALHASGGDRARALTLATHAREAYAEAGPDGASTLAEIDAWLARPALQTRASPPQHARTLGAYRLWW